MRIQPGRFVVPSLITLVLASAVLAGPAVTVGAVTAGTGPLPVVYNLGGGAGSAWNLPQVRPRKFFIFADGSAALIGMRWARWTRTRAVTSQAVYITMIRQAPLPAADKRECYRSPWQWASNRLQPGVPQESPQTVPTGISVEVVVAGCEGGHA